MKKKEESSKVEKEQEKAASMRPKLGDEVLFTKSIASQSGSSTRSFLAKIIGFPPKTSNFQDSDFAVDLIIFGQPGVLIDGKQGIMFSEVPTPGRWSPKE